MNTKYLKITLHNAGKEEPFHWKPLECATVRNMAEIVYDRDNIHKATHYSVPVRIRFFWLWFIVNVEIVRWYQSDTYWKSSPGPMNVGKSGELFGIKFKP